jgi:hypothetical protein
VTRILDLAGLEAISGVGPDDHKPFVHLRATSSYVTDSTAPADDRLDVVLIGQLDPSGAIDLGLRILEAASSAEFDAALYALMLRRLGDDPAAASKAGAILADLRAEREQPGG